MSKIINFLNNLTFLIKSDASFVIVAYYIKFYIKKKFFKLNSNQVIFAKNFKEYVQSKYLRFSSFWFLNNLNTFIYFLDNLFKDNKVKINILEIGCYEGMSSIFFLKFFEECKISCVDIFEKSLEYTHKKSKKRLIVLKNLKFRFNNNISVFKKRVKIFDSKSYNFFNNHKKIYNLIYIDGSHYSGDLLIDLIKSFEILKLNGYLIIDDYLWKYYKCIKNNPNFAINTFIKLNSKSVRIIYLNEVVILNKISNPNKQLITY